MASRLVGLACLALVLNECAEPLCGGGAWDDGGESTCMRPKWQSFTTANTDGGLVSNSVSAIAIDSGGGKWVGTWDGGVSHLSADNTTWTTYTTENTGGALVGGSVTAIALDSTGGKWVGAYDWISSDLSRGGVSHLSSDNTTWTAYTTENIGGGLTDSNVSAIAIDSAGGKWVGTWDGGVSHLSADNTTWTTYTTENTGGGLLGNWVHSITIDSAGGKWVGGRGVSHLSADNTTWTTYTTENTGGGLASNWVHAIAIDSAGGKWVGTWDGGVSHLSANNTAWTTYTYANTDGGLAFDWVNAIAIDSAGGKWVAAYAGISSDSSSGGVSHLSADNTTWSRYTTENTGGALLSNSAWAIAIDSAGGKWVATELGLSYWAATFGM